MRLINKISNLPLIISNSKVPNLLIDQSDIYLFSSIILETFSTICLKKTLIDKKWFIPSYLGYFVSFYYFPKCLDKYSLSVAYTIWCGIGILFTNLIDYFIYKEMLLKRKIIGTLLIILGIKLNK